ncbi:MAG: ankyrin repeat domain-containing protein, partial [Acidobacteria bacterium]|nr:ankyrin repeat domain-containing protein [Acidobacteriota bacterium]
MRKAIRGVGLVGAVALSLSMWVSAVALAPVADAVMNRDAEAVRTLIKNGADVNAAQGDGMTALHWAARNGDVELTRLLL